MDPSDIREQLERAMRRVLSDQNRDAHAPAHGCFDRRFWAWKLVDFPEATLQRQLLIVAWGYREASPSEKPVLLQSVEAGLLFAASIQHRDGSWDQAFPFERSFGATAFMLHPLLSAYEQVRTELDDKVRKEIESALRRAAEFLCAHNEEHGHIANHLAGAVLSLETAARFFDEPSYSRRADTLLATILDHQSNEGWFLEYEGADPGYQTLCTYYLASVQQLRPSERLHTALEKSVEFLSWFVHPDGTFGGEYGSRRTAIFYPGGFAILAAAGNKLAGAVLNVMVDAARAGKTVRLDQVDTGNLAPLASNYIALLQAAFDGEATEKLPCDRDNAAINFQEAGIYVRGTARYYAIVGASNGGVVKVFDRAAARAIYNDGGYVGRNSNGAYITTQATGRAATTTADATEIKIEAPFVRMSRVLPTPFKFLALRLLNLTLMRSVQFGNVVKRTLVRLLISGGATERMTLQRTVQFSPERVRVVDELRTQNAVRLAWLECGRPFVGIHMASARYYECAEASAASFERRSIDVALLARNGRFEQEITV